MSEQPDRTAWVTTACAVAFAGDEWRAAGQRSECEQRLLPDDGKNRFRPPAKRLSKHIGDVNRCSASPAGPDLGLDLEQDEKCVKLLDKSKCIHHNGCTWKTNLPGFGSRELVYLDIDVHTDDEGASNRDECRVACDNAKCDVAIWDEDAQPPCTLVSKDTLLTRSGEQQGVCNRDNYQRILDDKYTYWRTSKNTPCGFRWWCGGCSNDFDGIMKDIEFELAEQRFELAEQPTSGREFKEEKLKARLRNDESLGKWWRSTACINQEYQQKVQREAGKAPTPDWAQDRHTEAIALCRASIANVKTMPPNQEQSEQVGIGQFDFWNPSTLVDKVCDQAAEVFHDVSDGKCRARVMETAFKTALQPRDLEQDPKDQERTNHDGVKVGPFLYNICRTKTFSETDYPDSMCIEPGVCFDTKGKDECVAEFAPYVCPGIVHRTLALHGAGVTGDTIGTMLKACEQRLRSDEARAVAADEENEIIDVITDLALSALGDEIEDVAAFEDVYDLLMSTINVITEDDVQQGCRRCNGKGAKEAVASCRRDEETCAEDVGTSIRSLLEIVMG